MNWDVMLKLVGSILFFAPFLIALGFFLVIGAMVLFEAIVSLGAKTTPQKKPEGLVGVPRRQVPAGSH